MWQHELKEVIIVICAINSYCTVSLVGLKEIKEFPKALYTVQFH